MLRLLIISEAIKFYQPQKFIGIQVDTHMTEIIHKGRHLKSLIKSKNLYFPNLQYLILILICNYSANSRIIRVKISR